MHLVVAVDGSEQSKRALAHAIDLGEPAGATITAVYAVDPEVHAEGGIEPVNDISDAEDRLIIEDVADAEERGERVLQQMAAFAEEYGARVETDLVYGTPVEAISDYAEDVDADGLFVGRRGLSEEAERVIGSTSKALVERAAVPVTVVQ
ncbi:MAG: universal stress protein [Haloarculaceae archaeon]